MSCCTLHLQRRPTHATLHLSAASRPTSRNGWREYLQRRRLKATIFTLRGLDDRTLRDIGLDRSEIESVVHSKGAGRRLRYLDIGGITPRG